MATQRARREFLERVWRYGATAAATPTLAGLARWSWARPEDRHLALNDWKAYGYGPLVRSPDCPEFEIPETFKVVRISEALRPAAGRPGLTVPNAFDGMAAFPLRNGNVRLIRNHEMTDAAADGRAIGAPAYDPRASGGTSSLEVRIGGRGMNRSVEVIEEFVSLAGTRVNCAGGPTPWGSWLSAEENCHGLAQGFTRPHGYVFEVPAEARSTVSPVALTAMGRFVHEAVAVDPRTGIVYETEDAWYDPSDPTKPGAGFYRFIPKRRDHLAEGGRLQILAIEGRPGFVTARDLMPGTTLPARWIDIESPDPAAAESDASTVLREGLAKGAAVFARLEGAWAGDGGIYIVSTNGGNARAGQVFFYQPVDDVEGRLTLVFESPSPAVLDAPDNIVRTPRGGLVICEDGSADQYVRGLDRSGRILDLVRHPVVEGRPGPREFAGACFSPDGDVLFFNVQGSATVTGTNASVTYAMWGPWADGPL